MIAVSIPHHIAALLLAALLVSSSGCGLSDYEARLEAQQKRLKYMEEENKNLAERSLNLSDRMAEVLGGKYDEFFLRPPLGIAYDPEAKPAGRFDVYFNQKQNAEIQEVLLALAGEENADKFKQAVLKELKININANPAVKTIPKPLEDPDKVLRCDWYQGPNIQLYVPQNSPYQTAIAFRLSGGGNAAVIDERIKFCLASLLEGKKAKEQRLRVNAQAKQKAPAKKGEK